MSAGSFFWPQAAKIDPGVLARAGRVCHWAGLVIALPWPFIGIFAAWDNDPSNLLLALIGLVPAQIGRGLRYILAGE